MNQRVHHKGQIFLFSDVMKRSAFVDVMTTSELWLSGSAITSGSTGFGNCFVNMRLSFISLIYLRAKPNVTGVTSSVAVVELIDSLAIDWPVNLNPQTPRASLLNKSIKKWCIAISFNFLWKFLLRCLWYTYPKNIICFCYTSINLKLFRLAYRPSWKSSSWLPSAICVLSSDTLNLPF